MSSALVNNPTLGIIANRDGMAESDMEDEEELFEINLETVNNIPPPHYWESYFTATGSALLANCLLPIADVSSAVPAMSKACNMLEMEGLPNFVFAAESANVIPFSAKFLWNTTGLQHSELGA
ncbi:uncharacterized protein LOC110822865 [Carica papaya]|uniref:uncharacterized protein LOC110822865 n=1 Tax=Carica papaya TaxID=3649 RepID=UPI000B8C8BCD|nr:uncharacterized protein LOC110822865 [Carica papaya]